MKHEQSPQTAVDMKLMAEVVKELKEKFKPTYLSLTDFNYDFLRDHFLVTIADPVDSTKINFGDFQKAIDYVERRLSTADLIKPPETVPVQERYRLIEVFNQFLRDRRINGSSPLIHHTTYLLCDDRTTAPLPPYDGDRQLFLDVLRTHLLIYELKHSTIMLGKMDNLYHLQDKSWDVIVAELNPILDKLSQQKTA